VALFGERQKSELDKVIINGDGVTQRRDHAGHRLTVLTSDNGLSGPPTVSDYEGLLFGLPKQYRTKDWGACYIGNDTSYRRSRGIQVGAGDERRVFGMDHESYTLLNHAFKVQNDLPNNKVLFGCLKRFRLYSRGGAEVTVERGGRTLALSNTSLVVFPVAVGRAGRGRVQLRHLQRHAVLIVTAPARGAGSNRFTRPPNAPSGVPTVVEISIDTGANGYVLSRRAA
jgi:hypothetical protein